MNTRADHQVRRLIAVGLALFTSFAPSAPLLAAPDALRKGQTTEQPRAQNGLEETLKRAGQQVVAWLNAPSIPAASSQRISPARPEPSRRTGLEERKLLDVNGDLKPVTDEAARRGIPRETIVTFLERYVLSSSVPATLVFPVPAGHYPDRTPLWRYAALTVPAQGILHDAQGSGVRDLAAQSEFPAYRIYVTQAATGVILRVVPNLDEAIARDLAMVWQFATTPAVRGAVLAYMYHQAWGEMSYDELPSLEMLRVWLEGGEYNAVEGWGAAVVNVGLSDFATPAAGRPHWSEALQATWTTLHRHLSVVRDGLASFHAGLEETDWGRLVDATKTSQAVDAMAAARDAAIKRVAEAWEQARGDIRTLDGRPDQGMADVFHPTAPWLLFTDMFQDVPWVVLLGFHVTIGIAEPDAGALRTVLEALPISRDAYALIAPEAAKALRASPAEANVIPVENRAHLLQLLGLTERDLEPLRAATEKTQALFAAQAGLESQL